MSNQIVRSTYPFHYTEFRLVWDLLTDISESEYVTIAITLGTSKTIDVSVWELWGRV